MASRFLPTPNIQPRLYHGSSIGNLHVYRHHPLFGIRRYRGSPSLRIRRKLPQARSSFDECHYSWGSRLRQRYERCLEVSSLKYPQASGLTYSITFLWIGQILYPSFIAEMKEPKDFPKALAALSILELILFSVVAAVGYNYLGQYSTAPSIGSLLEPWQRKSAFAFVLVPTVIIGALYANVAGKFIFKRLMGNSRHAHSHSVIGWGTWILIDIGFWAIAFVLGK
jgi:hypothetical protein